MQIIQQIEKKQIEPLVLNYQQHQSHLEALQQNQLSSIVVAATRRRRSIIIFSNQIAFFPLLFKHLTLLQLFADKFKN